MACENMYFAGGETLKDRLADGELTAEDFERVSQLETGLLTVPWKKPKLHNADEAIAELSRTSKSGASYDTLLGIHDFTVPFFGPNSKEKFRPIHRLVAGWAFALKDADSKVTATTEKSKACNQQRRQWR